MPEDIPAPGENILEKAEQIVEDIVEGGERRSVKWIKGFIREMGKNSAIILFWLATFFLSEGFVNPQNFALFVTSITIIVVGIVLLLLVLRYFERIKDIEQKATKQAEANHVQTEADLKAFAETQMAIVNMFSTSEQKLKKRISGIEELTEEIQMDWNSETGEIVHVNKTFIRRFGFDPNHLRSIIDPGDKTSALKYVINTIVHPEDRERVFDINKRRLSGETIDSYKVYLLDKNKVKFFALIRAGKIQNNGDILFQFLIKDIQDEKDMKETILAQEGELENYKKSFMKKTIDEQTAIDLLSYLEEQGL